MGIAIRVPKLSLRSDGRMILHCPFEDRHLAKAVHGYKWDQVEKGWVYPIRPEVVEDLKRLFPHLQIEPEAAAAIERITIREQSANQFKDMKEVGEIPGYTFKTQPFEHQKKAMMFVLRLWGLV